MRRLERAPGGDPRGVDAEPHPRHPRQPARPQNLRVVTHYVPAPTATCSRWSPRRSRSSATRSRRPRPGTSGFGWRSRSSTPRRASAARRARRCRSPGSRASATRARETAASYAIAPRDGPAAVPVVDAGHRWPFYDRSPRRVGVARFTRLRLGRRRRRGHRGRAHPPRAQRARRFRSSAPPPRRRWCMPTTPNAAGRGRPLDGARR